MLYVETMQVQTPVGVATMPVYVFPADYPSFGGTYTLTGLRYQDAPSRGDIYLTPLGNYLLFV